MPQCNAYTNQRERCRIHAKINNEYCHVHSRHAPVSFEIEKIVKSRKRNNKREYKIKWKGYPWSQCTWEPHEGLPKSSVMFCNIGDPRERGQKVKQT